MLHLNDYALQVAPFRDMNSTIEYNTIQECMKAVEESPTAYDVDKVVEQLESERRIAFLTLANATDIPDMVYEKVSLYLDKAIEIVKSSAKQCEVDAK